jgi:hypothetical protein
LFGPHGKFCDVVRIAGLYMLSGVSVVFPEVGIQVDGKLPTSSSATSSTAPFLVKMAQKGLTKTMKLCSIWCMKVRGILEKRIQTMERS